MLGFSVEKGGKARKRFTAEPIIMKPREAEVGLAQGRTVGQVSKQIGVTERRPTTGGGRSTEGGAGLVLPLVQTADVQRFEQFEVAIVRKDGIDAGLPAQGDDLGIEHQVSVCIGLERGREKLVKKIDPGLDDLAVRSGGNRLDERGLLRQC